MGGARTVKVVGAEHLERLVEALLDPAVEVCEPDLRGDEDLGPRHARRLDALADPGRREGNVIVSDRRRRREGARDSLALVAVDEGAVTKEGRGRWVRQGQGGPQAGGRPGEARRRTGGGSRRGGRARRRRHTRQELVAREKRPSSQLGLIPGKADDTTHEPARFRGQWRGSWRRCWEGGREGGREEGKELPVSRAAWRSKRQGAE